MTNYAELSQNAVQFLSLTGYTVEEFQALLPHFDLKFQEHMKIKTKDGKKRIKRKYTEYQNSPLPTIENKLLFILLYLKEAPLQQSLAERFGMHQSDTNVWIHLLHTILNQTLGEIGELPERDAAVFEAKVASNDRYNFFHDGSERPINRPKDPEEQKEFYSGKKQQHTVKNNFVSDDTCKVIFLGETVEGKKHDKKLADEDGYTVPKGKNLYQDTGFQGFNPEGVNVIQPKKKPRKKELTKAEKEQNRIISQVRVRIEHVIGGVKRYRIVKDKLRNWRKGFKDLVIETCCGLHNFRLNFRPWNYETIPISTCITVVA